jgi:hypothetical protein
MVLTQGDIAMPGVGVKLKNRRVSAVLRDGGTAILLTFKRLEDGQVVETRFKLSLEAAHETAIMILALLGYPGEDMVQPLLDAIVAAGEQVGDSWRREQEQEQGEQHVI